MYILREFIGNANAVVSTDDETGEESIEENKVSGQYHLIGSSHATLSYFDLDTENPQGRLMINGVQMENQPYSDAEAEFKQIVDAAVAECKDQKQSFLNLSDLEVKAEKKASTTSRRTSQKTTKTGESAQAEDSSGN